MAATKTILQKLQEARDIVKELDTRKDGKNEYSNYDYYTPETVESLVREACKKTKTICLCNLRADEFGLYQTLVFQDLESKDAVDFELRTKHGSLKATNETQQMGGTDTYSERYIKMKVFQIKDNLLDFDSQDHREKPVNKQEFKDQQGVTKEVTGECDLCHSKAIPAKTKQGRVFATCPKWKEHSDKGEKFKIIQKPNLSASDQAFMDELDATKKAPKVDNQLIKK